ncbi:Dot/Icm T4SS effector [Legionella lansingensis]|uniref:Dot/Icm T4SS effector n=1 Tax=Legionella lansingensis TaxID=45067 RepID=A0A0W0VL12_9GAMM|nr:ankyrin repeat domain-containing protein [Legionella lansingensis]KTD20802.1 Dot/Icm T4SS effector [Legionella lansingensis]SNV49860.1 Dot/Icm T4SS effector [Legionella lansingensis]
MSKISEEARKAIQNLSNERLKNILLAHLTDDAQDQTQLFTKQHAYDRRFPDFERATYILPSGLTFDLLLNTVYVYAPTAVCHELTNALLECQDTEIVSFLSKSSQHHSDPRANEWVMETVMKYAPAESRAQIIQKVKTFTNEKNIIDSLFGDFYKRDFNHFIRLLNFADEAASLCLIETLSTLDKQVLFGLFQTSPFPATTHDALIDFFSTRPPEKLAFAALKLLFKFESGYLSRLVFGGGYFIGSSSNLLHSIFESQSENVVSEILLFLMQKLSEQEIKSLLMQKASNGSHNTPLELAFQRKDNMAVATTIAKAIYQVPNLKPLLSAVSVSQFYSAMHLAAQNNNTEVITFFVEHPDAPIDHTVYSQSRTMMDLAKEQGHQPTLNVFLALKIYHYIYQAVDKGPQYESWIKELLSQNPEIVHCRFSEQKTLLSHAASKGLASLVSLLLEMGALPEPDSRNLTPIDEALKSNFLQVLKAFTNSKINPEIIGEALVHSLAKITKPTPSYHDLGQALQQTSQSNTWATQIEDYCFQKNDCFIFLLFTIADLLSKTGEETLIQAVKTFVLESLQKLNGDATYLEANAIQLQLVVLLFSMTPCHFFSLLYSINLDDNGKKKLQLVLSRGLVQSAIFSRFTLEEHQLYYKFIRELSPQDDPLQSIAAIHFKYSPLFLLPAIILRELAASLPAESLLICNEQRLNPSLIVLTIEKLLEKDPVDEEKIKGLFAKLDNELQLFSKSASINQAEFQQMLNISCHPRVKTHIKKSLITNSSLKEKAKLLCTNYRKKTVIIGDGLLHDLLMEFASNSEWLSQNENHRAFIELLTTLTPADVQKIIGNLQNTLQPQRVILGTLAPVLIPSPTQNNLSFSNWIYNLENKRRRLAIAPLVHHLDSMQEQTRQLLALLDKENPTPLQTFLNKLAVTLDDLATKLFQTHLAKTGLVWNEDIADVLKKLELNFDTVKRALQNSSEVLDLRNKFPQEYSHFDNLISADNVHSLCHQITVILQQIDTDSNQFATNVVNKFATERDGSDVTPFFEPDPQVFSTEFTVTMATQCSKKTQIISQCEERILEGVLGNPDRAQLLPLLCERVQRYGSSSHKNLLLDKMPELLQTTSKQNWVKVNQQTNEILIVRENISLLLLDLQVLNLSTFELSELLTIFYETKEEILNQFVAFCSSPQLFDIRNIATYVLEAKRQQIPLDILKSQNPLAFGEDLSLWLQHKLEAIEKQAIHAMSYRVIEAGLLREREPVGSRLAALDSVIEEYHVSPSAKAFNLLISSYSNLLQANPSMESRSFLLSLSNLMKKMNVETINEAISQMPSPLVEHLVAHCLAGLNSDDPSHDHACRLLLTNFCQLQSTSNKQMLEQIKCQLGQQDLSLLGESSLVAIAQDILRANESDLMDMTFSGIWIQRLLTSPRFVAASNPQVIKALLDRYRLISLTLKQDEFDQLNHWLKTKLAFHEHHQQSMIRLEKSITVSDPKRREYFLQKRKRLLEFRADDSIRALLTQLEDQCIAEKQSNPEMAEAALDVLYTHYNNSLTSLRSDFLFKVADFIVGRVSRNKGDLEKAQDTLLKWLSYYLPHKNFEQTELTRKTHVTLHDAEGTQIGFLNEGNHAMTFIEDEPRSLLEVHGSYAGMPLYDDTRCLIGYLTSSGEVKRENLFQKETSALLIAKVPAEQLSKSPAALELLMTDVFTENTLGQLYANSEADKHAWIEEQISAHLTDTKKIIHKDNLVVIVQKHSANDTFSLLEKMKSKDNAAQLFEAILDDEVQRDELFDSKRQNAVFSFFAHNSIEQLLANYLLKYHTAPWFKNGLQLFANFAHTHSQPELLSNALTVLQKRTFIQKNITETTYDTILNSLIGSEACSKIIWNSFLNGRDDTTIDQIDSKLGENLSGFFWKHHCIPLIKSVNEQKDWSRSSQYRMLLLILAKQRKQIFQETELRYSEKFAWSSPELQQVSRFVSRHLRQPQNPDANLHMGNKLISQLLFRCANFGQVELFYDNKGRLDETIAGKIIERSYLDAIAARDYLPTAIRNTIDGIVSQFKSWFDDKHQENEQLRQLLKQNQALIDWKQLCQQSWNVSDSTTALPAISAYLLNYSGKPEALTRLVKDYFAAKPLRSDPKKRQAVSQVMAKFPQRDISSSLFLILEEIFTDHPQLLDRTMLTHMAKFYTYKYSKKEEKSPEMEIELIKHFGLQKKYQLVQQCCELLTGSKSNASYEQLLQKIQLEAKVEGQLSKYLSSWFFSVICFFKRWWHYGFGGEKKSSNLVNFCDAQTDYTHPVGHSEKIKTPVLSGQTIATQLETAKKLKALRERYSQFLKKYPPKETSNSKKLFHAKDEYNVPRNPIYGTKDKSTLTFFDNLPSNDNLGNNPSHFATTGIPEVFA